MQFSENDIDKNLILRLRDNDRDAFNEIYNRYQPRLRSFVLKYVKIPQYTDDIVQDTFLKIWEIRNNIDPERFCQTYLFTISRNLIFKFFKSATQDTDILNDIILSMVTSGVGPANAMENKELRVEIQHAIKLLPPKRQEIFLLSRDENMSYNEISNKLGISRNTVKEHIVLSMKFIKEHLIKRSLYFKAVLLLVVSAS